MSWHGAIHGNRTCKCDHRLAYHNAEDGGCSVRGCICVGFRHEFEEPNTFAYMATFSTVPYDTVDETKNEPIP